jgi:prophage DNA circulation protein
VDYKIWGTMHERVYQTKVRDVDDLKRRLIEVCDSLEQSVLTMRSTSGVRDFVLMSGQKEEILDT